jgi:general nucleoside transport system permease protein
VSTFAATTEAVRRFTGPRRVGIVGIGLGLFGAWLALPPVNSRTIAWPAVFAVIAMGAGLWAALRGERKLGWGAVAAGVFAIGIAVVAERSSTGHLSGAINWGTLVSQTFIFATPLTFVALGGMFAERSGVVNIGLEGMMLMGAFFGILGGIELSSWPLGLLVAMASGGALALIYAVFAIHLRADQIVGGTAIIFLSYGITGYFYIRVYGENGTPISQFNIPDFNWLGDHVLSHVPPGHFWEAAFGHLNLMVWVSLALLVACHLLMFRTSLGLRIRAVGEHPRAADTVGISVYATRYVCVVVSGILAAAGGAYLVSFAGGFQEQMTDGRGFVALAALIFGNWRPFGAFGATMLFGFSSALVYQLQGTYTSNVALPTSGSAALLLLFALPYVVTLVAVAGVIGRSIPPAASGRPYVKQ